MTPTALDSAEWADTQASPSPGPAPGPALLGFLEGRPKPVGGKVSSCSSWMHPGVGVTEDPLEVPGPLLSFPFTLRACPESAGTLCSVRGCTPREHTPGWTGLGVLGGLKIPRSSSLQPERNILQIHQTHSGSPSLTSSITSNLRSNYPYPRKPRSPQPPLCCC